jgi:glycosyltransferase involved in cell wall biosynthesis
MRILVISNYRMPVYSLRPEAAIFTGLAQKGHDITVMSYPDSNYREEFSRAGINFLPFHPQKKYDPAFVRALRVELDRRPYDIVHAFNKKGITNAILCLLGRPEKLVTYRGVTGYAPWYDPTAYLAHLNPRVDGITCVSQSASDYLKRQVVNKRKIYTVYKGHDLGWYDGIEPADLAQFDIPDGATTGICVANIRRMKGLKYLLEATCLLTGPDNFHLLLVGQGMDHPKFAKLIRESPMRERIHLAGYRPDVVSLVRASDFLILPSIRGEGLPKAVIEAMAQGIPAIATRVGGCPELIEDGISGKIVEPRSPEALADAVISFCQSTDHLPDMGRKARERIGTHFHVQVGVDGMERAYRSILG